MAKSAFFAKFAKFRKILKLIKFSKYGALTYYIPCELKFSSVSLIPKICGFQQHEELGHMPYISYGGFSVMCTVKIVFKIKMISRKIKAQRCCLNDMP